jgi:hypothetical protein
MSNKFFTLDQLSRGIRDKNVAAERARLVEKWSRTGLLRGLDGYRREYMSQLLENQASQVLKESSGVGAGTSPLAASGLLQGFSNIAFPIVRRVFGGLVANELVSIQPMSLPSGLIFYIDYTYGSKVGGVSDATSTYTRGQSIYNNPAGKAVQFGSDAVGGMYDLVGAGYSRVHRSGSARVDVDSRALGRFGTGVGADGTFDALTLFSSASADTVVDSLSKFSGPTAKLLQFDEQVEKDLAEGNLDVLLAFVSTASLKTAMPDIDMQTPEQIALFSMVSGSALAAVTGVEAWGTLYQAGAGVLNLRRLTKVVNLTESSGKPSAVSFSSRGTHLMFPLRLTNAASFPLGGVGSAHTASLSFSAATVDKIAVDSESGAVTSVPSFESNFATDPTPAIPEIDIKVESIAISAVTKKLRAKWSPELAQDLNAYHSLDAEVELTAILSEQIALEIDREIVSDLLTQASGANLYWSRAPGKFVNKETGEPVLRTSSFAPGPNFTGTVREWYETLVETIIDAANTIHRKTLRGSANFVVTSPDVCTVLEASVLYKPKFSIDKNGQVGAPFTVASAGAEAVGTLTNRFTVYKDPYFPRNRILLGYKGGSYLETGYVYSPYVPLIVTPTIFAPEDFTPRKGVMTRYGKKMVRADFYGTVTCLDMNIL